MCFKKTMNHTMMVDLEGKEYWNYDVHCSILWLCCIIEYLFTGKQIFGRDGALTLIGGHGIFEGALTLIGRHGICTILMDSAIK